MLNKSLRSEIHATDSTCCGWSPNNAATMLRANGGRHDEKYSKDQQRIDDVQRQIDQMMHARMVRAEELAIDNMRQHRERVPIPFGDAGHGVDDVCTRKPGVHVAICIDVLVVVQKHEIERINGPVNADDRQYQ